MQVIVILLVATVATLPTSNAYYDDKAHYKFGYGVYDPHTHDHKHHMELRHGNHVVGEYSVKEPDGSFRLVKYKAGPDSGFEAYVEEIGKPYDAEKESVNDIGVFRWDNEDHEIAHEYEDNKSEDY